MDETSRLMVHGIQHSLQVVKSLSDCIDDTWQSSMINDIQIEFQKLINHLEKGGEK